MYNTYPFKLNPLPYEYDEMEPYIDKETMFLHHDKHLKNYIDKLNLAISKYPKLYNWPLEKLLTSIMFLPEDIKTDIKNNAGGVYNHNLYFEGLKKVGKGNIPIGKLARKIDFQYTNFNDFYNKFKEKALSVFGSGYAWLVLNNECKLDIVTTKNQDTVLSLNLCPIILIDVWEHAYYLKYNNRREEYIENYKNIIDWQKAEQRYEKCLKNCIK